MIYFITGMPLSGKSTIAKRMAAEGNMEYFSTGEYARSLGMGMEPSIATMDLSNALDYEIGTTVHRKCQATVISNKNIIIDGYPRSIAQFLSLSRIGTPLMDWCRIIFVTVNPLEAFDRMKDRKIAEGRPEDELSVVTGRISRSLEWMRELSIFNEPAVLKVSCEDGYDRILGLIDDTIK